MKTVLTIILVWAGTSLAQTNNIQPLKIGDKVPDLKLKNVFNYKSETAKLSEFKNKYIILDFWATWCGGCIDAMPKIQHYQDKFADNLSIILVNSYEGDTFKNVNTFFNSLQKRTGWNLRLTYALQQQQLARYFPYKFIPHYVWINRQRKVVAITSSTEVNEDNLRDFISGRNLNLHQKRDNFSYNNQLPLFTKNNGGEENSTIYRSILTGYQEGLGSGVSGTNEPGKRTILNHSVRDMYQLAFREDFNISPNRIILEVRESEKWKRSFHDSLRYKNLFCYELTTQKTTGKQISAWMREDLIRVFGVTVNKEKRRMSCLTLNKIMENAAKSTSQHLPGISIDRDDIDKYLYNQPVAALLNILNSFLPVPILDNTKIDYLIDLKLPADLYNMNINDVNLFLKENGFELREVNQEIDVVVLKDG